VNVAARLASAAYAGEILVTLAAVHAPKLSQDGLERRDLELKGKSGPTSGARLDPIAEVPRRGISDPPLPRGAYHFSRGMHEQTF